MCKRSVNVLSMLLVALMTVLGFASPAIATPGEEKEEKHCVVWIEPVQGLDLFSKVGDMKCYETVAEAVEAATGGKVILSPLTKASEIGEWMYNTEGIEATLIGTDYTEPNFGGSSLQWTAPSGCFYNGTQPSYSAASMPAGWDNVVSSARSFSNCRAILYYDATNLGGLSMVTGCQASSLGFMDNRTSSHQWSDQRYGQSCPF